jgi:single-stranded DNA-specific DHH superfamily exonuclease
VQLNEAGRRKARNMIESSQYILDSSWSEANPSADQENAFLETHSWAEYGEWHLGIDKTAAQETKDRYGFPYGDFRRVHRSGLIAAKQRAAQNDFASVERAAEELLSLLDERAG